MSRTITDKELNALLKGALIKGAGLSLPRAPHDTLSVSLNLQRGVVGMAVTFPATGAQWKRIKELYESPLGHEGDEK